MRALQEKILPLVDKYFTHDVGDRMKLQQRARLLRPGAPVAPARAPAAPAAPAGAPVPKKFDPAAEVQRTSPIIAHNIQQEFNRAPLSHVQSIVDKLMADSIPKGPRTKEEIQQALKKVYEIARHTVETQEK